MTDPIFLLVTSLSPELAELAVPQVPAVSKPVWWKDIAVLGAICAMLMASLLLLTGLVYSQKKKRRKRKAKSSGSDQASSLSSTQNSQPQATEELREHRRHKRRFPTLAETGGLPPKRQLPRKDIPSSPIDPTQLP